MPPTAPEIIASSQWESILFTTYALSLSFFESVVWRAVRNCPNVCILVDAQGYQATLIEQHSRRVGLEYRLFPVSLPRGVFHPKCTYLAGPEGDRLLVGSGNLTFGGWGRNLEVLDILDQRTPAVFAAFADFLYELKERADVQLSEPQCVEPFLLRSREVADRPGEEHEGTFLLTSTREPVGDQIARLAEEIGPVQELLVLSPYFDREGAAVERLATRLDAGTVSIGLPTDPKEVTAFPFDRALGWGRGLSAVTPDTEGLERPLHAKWIEVVGKSGRLTVTGSVNATYAALWTTNNIEVAVTRLERSQQSRRACWLPAAIPEEHAPCEFPARDEEGPHALFARLQDDGTLVGRILGTRPEFEGSWTGILADSYGTREEIDALVDRSGDVLADLSSARHLAASSRCLQLELRKDSLVARGWVHVEAILELARGYGDISAVIRCSYGDASDSDAIALLNFLSLSMHRHMPSFSAPIDVEASPSGAPRQPAEAPSVVVRLDELLPREEEGGTVSDSVASRGTVSALEQIFSRLRARLLSSGYQLAASALPDEGESVDRALQESERTERRIRSSVLDFDRQVETLLESCDDQQARTWLVIWLEVKLFLLKRLPDCLEDMLEFVKEWFASATSLCSFSPKRDALNQHVSMGAAMLAWNAWRSEPDPLEVVRHLHALLERYFEGEVVTEAALESLPGTLPPVLAILAGEADVNARLELEKLLSVRTVRSLVLEILEARRSGRAVPDVGSVIRSEAGRNHMAMLVGANPSRDVVVCEEVGESCPACRIELHSNAFGELANYRVTRCRNSCRKVIVETGL